MTINNDITTKNNAIVLIGMMGAGKTTIGKALALESHRQFIDLDHFIVTRCGVDIPTIFDIEGEQGFRKRETACLHEVVQLNNVVLATGGGAILSEENRQLLKNFGTIIYLEVSVDELFRRVAKDRNRPLLATDNPKQRLRDLLALREPTYRQLADIILPSDSNCVHTMVKRIQHRLAHE